MSCAATGGLTLLFAAADASHAGSTAIAGLPVPVPVTGQATATPTVPTPPQASPSTSPTTAPAAAPAVSSAAPPQASPSTAPATSAASPQASPSTAAASASSAFNGDVVQTKYGPVEVQAQFNNGALTEVAVVEYPSDDRKSVRINTDALPKLRTEALTAQSATVHTVSGATYTSDAYTQSLQSAIDAAHTAGATTL